MIRKNLPNMMTLGNLFCGCLAIVSLAEANIVATSVLVGIALVLDFFDGFTARLLGVSSPIGKDLDSLADMVTFGVVPGYTMFFLLSQACHSEQDVFTGFLSCLPFTGFFITLFSCVRLAKFNNDSRQSDRFIGVPTPANTILIVSLALLHEREPGAAPWLWTAWPLVILTVVCSYMLVAEMPLIALKFRNFSWADNKFRFLLIALSLALVALAGLKALPLIILLYILMSIVNNIFSNNRSES